MPKTSREQQQLDGRQHARLGSAKATAMATDSEWLDATLELGRLRSRDVRGAVKSTSGVESTPTGRPRRADSNRYRPAQGTLPAEGKKENLLGRAAGVKAAHRRWSVRDSHHYSRAESAVGTARLDLGLVESERKVEECRAMCACCMRALECRQRLSRLTGGVVRLWGNSGSNVDE